MPQPGNEPDSSDPPDGRPGAEAVREANHRIANSLASLASFVRLHASELLRNPALTHERALDVLEEVQVRLLTVGRLHRLLATMEDSTATVDETLHQVCAATISSMSLPGQIELVEDLQPGLRLAADRMTAIAQIVTEVVANAIKHAYRDGNGRIVLRSHVDGEDLLVVEVEDQGPGLPPTFSSARSGGQGFAIIRSLVEQMGGEAELLPAFPGLLFRLRAPLTALRRAAAAAGTAPQPPELQ